MMQDDNPQATTGILPNMTHIDYQVDPPHSGPHVLKMLKPL